MSSIPVDADEEMYVTKRNGNKEIVSFDKILRRIKTLGTEANIKLNYYFFGNESYRSDL